MIQLTTYNSGLRLSSIVSLTKTRATALTETSPLKNSERQGAILQPSHPLFSHTPLSYDVSDRMADEKKKQQQKNTVVNFL